MGRAQVRTGGRRIKRNQRTPPHHHQHRHPSKRKSKWDNLSLIFPDSINFASSYWELCRNLFNYLIYFFFYMFYRPLFENPFLPKVTEIEEGEIPKDPFNRLMRAVPTDKEKDNEEDKVKDGKKRKRSKRSRSRGRDERRRDRERRHDQQDKGRQVGERREERGRSPRTQMEGFSGGNYRKFSNLPLSRGTMNSDKKIKGRGRIVSLTFTFSLCFDYYLPIMIWFDLFLKRYRPSRSRSRSKTPPHWKAECRKTISLKEFEVRTPPPINQE